MPSRRTTPASVAALALSMLLGAGCGGGDGPGADQGPVDRGPTHAATPPREPTRSPADGGRPAEDQETPMQIRMTIRDETFTATLHDSAAADDLLAQLPVTVEMADHGGVEKTGRLPAGLSLEGQPEGADPDIGDLGYYAPGNDLVLYYGDQSYFPGIVVLGRLDGDAAERIAGMDGAVTAIVEAR